MSIFVSIVISIFYQKNPEKFGKNPPYGLPIREKSGILQGYKMHYSVISIKFSSSPTIQLS